ncbi:MAG: DUF2017 family protein [Verrucomicrobiae bacterium]
MKLKESDDGGILLEEIPPFLFHLLGEISSRAEIKHPRVDARFFPDPSEDSELIEDWKSLVQPELQAIFQSARETVRADLRGASERDGSMSLQIPKPHGDAWLSALNQARLAMVEEAGFGEKDMAAEVPDDLRTPRDAALFQLGFYGFLQECLVRMQGD